MRIARPHGLKNRKNAESGKENTMKQISFSYSRQRFHEGFDGKTCKIVPYVATDGKTTLISYQHLLLTGMDVPLGKYILKSTDGGKTWSDPIPQPALADEQIENGRISYWCFLQYNKTHKKWFGLGISETFYNDKAPNGIAGLTLCTPTYCEVDAEKGEVTSHKPLDFPLPFAGAVPGGQVLELEGGDILVAFDFFTKEHPKAAVVTVRYTFTEDGLKVVKVGEPIYGDDHARGLCEPAVAKLGNKYYMAIRSDEIGLYAVSEDGYHFSEPKPYRWDDGSILENYNTQQKWMTAPDGLFLVYNRKGANNDHIFRHRAPLFMTRFDEEGECLVRSEEVILVPEMGARLGNFCSFAVSENEAWVSVAEWMQRYLGDSHVCANYGSNNALWIARVRFGEKPI